MDPIGFALENFDWTGRWRDKEFDGSPIDASGTLPSGEKFNGPAELRQVLLDKKDDFLRHLTGKLLGYALGRNLQDGDSCTVQKLADKLQQDNYRARTHDPRNRAEHSVPQQSGRPGGDGDAAPAAAQAYAPHGGEMMESLRQQSAAGSGYRATRSSSPPPSSRGCSQ